jgi:holin-like protein
MILPAPRDRAARRYSERVSEPTAPARRRPVTVTIAVILVYISGVTTAAMGTLILLSRYRVEPAQVLPVSLLGAAVILFGLLTLAVASGVSRGRRLARLLLTIYIAIQVTLQAVTIISTESWDWSALTEMAVDAFIVIALWAPPGSRYFGEVGVDGIADAAAA